jgi:hypothetical protein
MLKEAYLETLTKIMKVIHWASGAEISLIIQEDSEEKDHRVTYPASPHVKWLKKHEEATNSFSF